MTDKPEAADFSSTEIAQLDKPYNKQIAENITIEPGQGVLLRDMREMIQAAKLMARSGVCVPPHCRDEEGVCFAILYKANALGLKDPFFVAEHSYPMEKWDPKAKQKVETLAYDSSIFHAAIEVSGILRGPLRCEYEGEGETLRCTVFGTFKGEAVPHSHQSPTLKIVHPGHVVKDGNKYVKGSPLWDRKPEQQLFYDTVRDWVRKYAPHVVGGIYDKDEFAEYEDMLPAPAAPKLMERLPGRMEGPGFSGVTDTKEAAEPKPKKARAKKEAA